MKLWMISLLFLSGCVSLQKETVLAPKKANPYSAENMLKIQTGMSSKQIYEIFGPPKEVRQTICGGDEPWQCTTWEYGEITEQNASFTFSGKGPDNLILNNFNIDRD